MEPSEALSEIQRMHETKTVRRESIIGWYYWYARKLPKMRPERSIVDLVRTAALWMELTDRGGQPGFPYDYRSELDLSTIEAALPAKPNWGARWAVRLEGLLLIAGVIALFIKPLLGVGLIVIVPVVWWIAYQLSGGPTNPDLLRGDTTLFRREGKRVLEWSRQHSTGSDGSAEGSS